MLFLFLLFFGTEDALPGNWRTIDLENNMRLIEIYRGQQVKLDTENGLLLMAPSEFYHFSLDGKLIKRVGRKGQGPGEFGYVMTGTIAANHYWMVDGSHFTVEQFRTDGTFVKSHRMYFPDLTKCVDGTVIAKIGGGYKQLQKERRHTLIELSFSSEGIKKVGEPFHMLPKRVPEISYEYTEPLVDSANGKLYVTCEIDPRIWVYQKSDKRLLTNPPIQMALPGFVLDPPKKFRLVGPGGAKEFWKWEDSFSRVVGFQKTEQGYAVVYEVPGGEKIRHKQRTFRLALLNERGECIHTQPCPGKLVGASKNRLVFFEDWNENRDEDPTYRLLELTL